MAVARRRGTRGNLDAHIHSNSHYKKRDLTDYLSTDYKDYCLYVIRTRAVSSLIDGMKVGARKVMHSCFEGSMCKNIPISSSDSHKIKMLNLVGDVYSLTLFQHGDAGLCSSIFTMASDFTNPIAPLYIDGQHGTLRSPDGQSAPRYLSIKLSKYAKILKEDYDLLEYVYDEGEYLEPKVYLPIIPLILTSSSVGLAPGYKAMVSVSRNVLDLIDICTEYLKKEKITKVLRPYVNNIKQDSFIFDKTLNRWVNVGAYKLDIAHDLMTITDLPFDVTFSEIESIFNDMKEKMTIKDWRNYSDGNKLDYRVWFNKNQLSKLTVHENIRKFEKQFRLTTIIQPDILNVLDENGKLRYFNNEYDLIEHFVKWRLTIYTKRKTRLVDVLQNKFERNNDVCKFIELVNSGNIKIQNRKKSDIKKELKNYELPDSVLSIEISKLTEEEKAQLLKKNEEIKKELEYIKNTDIKDMYLNDLKKLRKELENDFS